MTLKNGSHQKNYINKEMNKKELTDKITKLLEDEPSLNINDAITKIMKEDGNDDTNRTSKILIEKKQTCSNFWCKASYNVKFYEGDNFPKTCPKCDSFAYELSDGIEHEEKHYDGPRHDGLAHQVDFHFSQYKNGRGFWNK